MGFTTETSLRLANNLHISSCIEGPARLCDPYSASGRRYIVCSPVRDWQMNSSTDPMPARPLRCCLTGVRLQATVYEVKIRNFAHKGLKRLYAEDSAKGVPPNTADKLRKMLAFLDDMEDAEELRSLVAWKAHTLTGDREGTWSLSVTGNRRLTFRIDRAEHEICDVNLEDYH